MTWTADLVEERLREAWDTLKALPDHEAKWLYGTGGGWLQLVRQAIEGYGYEPAGEPHAVPTPEAIDRAIPTLRWLRWLDREHKRLVVARLQDLTFDRLTRLRWHFSRRRKLGREALRTRHLLALKMIAKELEKRGA